jgi:hypothetical protein
MNGWSQRDKRGAWPRKEAVKNSVATKSEIATQENSPKVRREKIETQEIQPQETKPHSNKKVNAPRLKSRRATPKQQA